MTMPLLPAWLTRIARFVYHEILVARVTVDASVQQVAPWRAGFGRWLAAQLQVFLLVQLEVVHRALSAEDTNEAENYKGLPHVDNLAGGKKGQVTSHGKGGMNMDTPITKDVVLIGGGHTHVYVLKNFAMNPIPGVRLTLITRDLETPYSGMVPGYVAGFYTREECHIDLSRLARYAQARLIHAEATKVDTVKRRVYLSDNRPFLRYDILSIDIGSTPYVPPALRNLPPDTPEITPVKPIDGFAKRWDAILKRAVEVMKENTEKGGLYRVVIVGGGAGGVELCLSMQARLLDELSAHSKDISGLKFTLVTRGKAVMESHNRGVQYIFSKILAERGVDLMLKFEVADAQGGFLLSADGREVQYDECIWCTQAQGAPWLREPVNSSEKPEFELTPRGFIQVDETLQCVGKPGVFAAGDIAEVVGHPRSKAGVFAVRQGPPLAKNIRLLLQGKSLAPFVPQRDFLGLIGTGRADMCVASRGQMVVAADWLWALKDWIDRTWMQGYSQFPNMEGLDHASQLSVTSDDIIPPLPSPHMRCGGCGSKVGPNILQRVLARLHAPAPPSVLAGVSASDDCALVSIPTGATVAVQTVDFFRTFVSDPYLFGRIAANHALSDCHAMGVQAHSALAIAIVPFGREDKIEDNLLQMMAGALHTLNEAGCALVGGHSGEGKEMALGFSVTGYGNPTEMLRKGPLVEGHVLVLSKPIGVGVIMAADMRAKATARQYLHAVDVMLQSNWPASQCLKQHGASACTDVTGFGLLGHLLEMCDASPNTCVHLSLPSVPCLPGAIELSQCGVQSTLAPQNRQVEQRLTIEDGADTHPAYPLLFDPQTAGGLLASIPAERANDCIGRLADLGYKSACVIGSIAGRKETDPPVVVMSG